MGNKMTGFLSTVFAFDLGDSSMEVLPGKMAVGGMRMGCQILEEEGKLLVAGGVTRGFKMTQLMEVLDLATGVWSSLRNRPKILGWPEYFQLGNSLALIDQAQPTLFYQYDHSNDEWDEIPRSSSASQFGGGHKTIAINRSDLSFVC